MRPEPTFDILLVEDNPADIELTRQSLRESELSHRLHVARDGVEAMNLLRGTGPQPVPRPDLVLLDLNMPRMDGRDVLAAMKSDETLCEIPVVILTTSQAPDDVEGCYRDHANAFMTKPSDFDEFVDMVQVAGEYWFQWTELPSRV